MELLRGIHNLKAKHRGCVLSIGVGFDNSNGVHLGLRYAAMTNKNR